MLALRLTGARVGQLTPLLTPLRNTPGLRSAVAARGMKDATVSEAKELLSSGHKYLDVRTAEEYEMGHAEGSINIPVMVKAAGNMTPNPKFMPDIKDTFPDKSVPLVVGCASGKRSSTAIGQMEHEGYTELTNLKGGYAAWTGEGQSHPTNTG